MRRQGLLGLTNKIVQIRIEGVRTLHVSPAAGAAVMRRRQLTPPLCLPSSPKHFSNKVLCINMLEEKFGLLLVATFWSVFEKYGLGRQAKRLTFLGLEIWVVLDNSGFTKSRSLSFL